LVQGFVKMSDSIKMVFLLNVNHAHLSHVVRLYSKDTIILYYPSILLYCLRRMHSFVLFIKTTLLWRYINTLFSVETVSQ